MSKDHHGGTIQMLSSPLNVSADGGLIDLHFHIRISNGFFISVSPWPQHLSWVLPLTKTRRTFFSSSTKVK